MPFSPCTVREECCLPLSVALLRWQWVRGKNQTLLLSQRCCSGTCPGKTLGRLQRTVVISSPAMAPGVSKASLSLPLGTNPSCCPGQHSTLYPVNFSSTEGFPSAYTNVLLPPIFKETNILGTRSLFNYHPIVLLHCRVKFLQRIIDFHSHCPLSFFLEPFTGHCSPNAPETALPKGGSHRYLLVRSQSSSSPTYQQRWAT